jgi:hypothetical protein
MSKASKIKAIVKGPAPKSTFGTDPSDPWSTKANIAEWAGNPAGLLAKYLKSRGINPKFASKDQKIAHSKTGQFQKWQKDHSERSSPTGTTVHAEEVDKKDTVTLDIPLLIRVLELAREDIKSDMDLHRVVERLIDMRNNGVLTMDDYDTIAQIKENHIAIAMGKMLDDEGSMVLDQLEQLERSIEMIRSYVGKDYKKQLPAWVQSKVTLATDYVDTVGNYLASKNEDVNEAKEANYGGDYQNSVKSLKAKAEKKPVDMKSLVARMQASYAKDKKTVKEGAPIVVMPAPIDVRNPKKEFQKLDLDKIGTPAKPPSTEKRGVKGRPGQRPMPTYEETVAEGNGYDDNRTGFAKKPREDDEGYGKPKFKAKDIMDRPHTVHIDGKPWKKFSSGHQAHAAANTLTAKGKKATAIAHMSEDTYQDPQAATQTVFDGGNNPNDTTPQEYKGKRLIQMSKSARIIKNLYKQKGVKEETYDFEKADKSVASYGKPPKMKVTDKSITDGDKEQAAIVLSGGKTLTGDERDTVEIDPKLKMRPNQQPEPVKSGNPQVK